MGWLDALLWEIPHPEKSGSSDNILLPSLPPRNSKGCAPVEELGGVRLGAVGAIRIELESDQAVSVLVAVL